MIQRSLGTIALLVAVSLLAGCFGDDDEDGDTTPTVTATAETPTVTATPTGTATPAATPTPTATPPPTPATGEGSRYGVWSVDIESLEVAVLHEGDRHGQLTTFSDDDAWLSYAEDRRSARFGLDGSLLEESDGFHPREPTGPTCEQDEAGDLAVRIDGVEYEANCGLYSPDGSQMLYTVELGGGSGVPLAEYRSWVLDLDTGTSTEIDATLRHCGGCDGIAGPSWSPSGRYLLVGETYTGPDSSVYLFDTESGETRRVAQGPSVNGVFFEPNWLPEEDAFLRPGIGDESVFAQADGSSEVPLDLPWPARVTGSPQWAVSLGWGQGGRGEVAVVDLASGEELARWPGRLEVGGLFARRIDEWGVGVFDGQPAGVVTGVGDCEGSLLHHPSLDVDGVCLQGAEAAMLSPDASRVAFARRSGMADFMIEWQIVIREIESGSEDVLPRTLFDIQPPLLRWTADGRHLLVQWPRPGL